MHINEFKHLESPVKATNGINEPIALVACERQPDAEGSRFDVVWVGAPDNPLGAEWERHRNGAAFSSLDDANKAIAEFAALVFR